MSSNFREEISALRKRKSVAARKAQSAAHICKPEPRDPESFLSASLGMDGYTFSLQALQEDIETVARFYAYGGDGGARDEDEAAIWSRLAAQVSDFQCSIYQITPDFLNRLDVKLRRHGKNFMLRIMFALVRDIKKLSTRTTREFPLYNPSDWVINILTHSITHQTSQESLVRMYCRVQPNRTTEKILENVSSATTQNCTMGLGGCLKNLCLFSSLVKSVSPVSLPA